MGPSLWFSAWGRPVGAARGPGRRGGTAEGKWPVRCRKRRESSQALVQELEAGRAELLCGPVTGGVEGRSTHLWCNDPGRVLPPDTGAICFIEVARAKHTPLLLWGACFSNQPLQYGAAQLTGPSQDLRTVPATRAPGRAAHCGCSGHNIVAAKVQWDVLIWRPEPVDILHHVLVTLKLHAC